LRILGAMVRSIKAKDGAVLIVEIVRRVEVKPDSLNI
jgi:hypothetical protein